MPKIKCYSVKLQSLCSISEKCYKAKSYDGREALIPKSQVFGYDEDVQKSEAYWISEWILKQKDIQYSTKKVGWFNSDTNKIEQNFHITIKKHIPKKVYNIEVKPDEELIR
jgi:hypothetical protein